MKKRIISLLLVLALCLSLLPMAAMAADEALADDAPAQTANETPPAAEEALLSTEGAAGTESDPILIGSLSELEAFRDRVNERDDRTLCAQLTADITLGSSWTSIGNNQAYTGTFDGNGHTIKAENGVTNLFGTIGNAGKVQDLTVEIDTMTASSGSGVIANVNNGTIERCSVRIYGTLTISSYFGLIAYGNAGTIEHCRGSVSNFSASNTTASAAGIAYTNYGTIRSCYFAGKFPYDSTNSKPMHYAITASMYGGTVENCYCLNGYLYYDKYNYLDEQLSGVHGAAERQHHNKTYDYTLENGQVTWLLNNGEGASTNYTEPWRLDKQGVGGTPTLDPADGRVTKNGDTYTVETLHTHIAGGRLHEFEALTDTPEGSGYYYLSADTTLSSAWTITGETVLCLNGKTLQTGSNTITVEAGGTLTLMTHDKKTGGTVTGTGTIVALQGGTLVMQGGTISGGTTGVVLPSDSAFRMEGGEITGCSTGVSVEGGSLTLSGSAKVSENSSQNILLAEASVLSFGELNTDAKFGISLTDQESMVAYERVSVTDETGGQYHGQLFADGFQESGAGFDLYLSEDGKTVYFGKQTVHIHKLGNDEEVTFLPWTETTSLPQTGNYYLTRNVTLTNSVTLKSANICLNGYTITLLGSATRINVGSNGSKNASGALTDCAGKGTVTGGGVIIQYNSTFSLYNGTLNGTKTEIIQSGGTFNMYGGKITNYTGDASTVTGQDAKGININLYGGEISGNHVSGDCGGVWVGAGNAFTMSGGAIKNNTGASAGGVGFTTGNTTYPTGTMTVSGSAVIQNNTAKSLKSNVCLPAGVTITIGSTLTAGAQIGVRSTATTPGAITGNNSADMSGYFTSDDPRYRPADTEGTHAVTLSRLPELTIRKGADVTQPYGTEGGKVTLDMSNTEGHTLSYQWYEQTDPNETETQRLIPGATGAEYPIAKDTPVGTYYYYCVVRAAELGEQITTELTKVTITKATWSDCVEVSIPVYFNTATTYTRELARDLPTLGAGLTFGDHVSYAIASTQCNSSWIEQDSVQLTSDNELTFTSKAASDAEDQDVLMVNITVSSDNYVDFTIRLIGRASPKQEENLATSQVRWTYGETPKDPKDPKTGAVHDVPSDAVWIRTTYTDEQGNPIEAPTNAGEYNFKVEYESLSTHYTAEGDLVIEPMLVDKDWVEITNTHTTYDGTTKYAWEVITVTVTVNGETITLSSDDFYTGGVTAAADASTDPKRGQLTLQGNYQLIGDGGIDFTWYIDPLEAELELVNADGRKYGDGKGDVTLRVKNATEHSPVTVTYDGGSDLSVGDHQITATALRKADGTENTNYKLPGSRRLTYHIAKGDAPAEKRLSMDVYNNTAKTYTYDFTKELPTDLTLGNYSYSGSLGGHETDLIDESTVRFQNGVLTFTTVKWTSESDNFVLWYEVTVTSDNYEDFKLYLTAYPKDKPQSTVPEADITMDGWTYGQTPSTPSVANLPEGVTPTFTYKNASGEEITPANTTDAGEYTLTVRYETDDRVYTGTKPFTVAPKTLTAADIQPSSYTKSKTYDGSTAYTMGGTKVNDDACVGTDNGLCVYGTTAFNSPNVAEANKVIFTANGTIDNSFDQSGKTNANNYTIASGTSWEYDAKIDPRPIAFTVDSVSKRFGSDTADVRVTFTGVAGNSQSGLVDGETLEQGVDYDVSATFSRTDFGTDNNVTVTVTLKDTVKAKNYKLSNPTLTGVTGTITKAAAPVVPEQTVEIYSNAETSYAIDLTKGWTGTPTISDYDRDRNSPYLEADELSDLLYNNASYLIPAPGEWNGTIYLNAKAFDADVGTDLGVLRVVLKSANYDDLTLRVRVKVKAKAQETLAVSLTGWTYGETANQPAYTAPAGATETTLTYTSRDGKTDYGATPPTDAGDYTLTVRCEGIDTIWTGTADFTIAAAKLTVTALDKEMTAGEDAPDLSKPVKDVDYKVEGLLGTDVLTNVTLSYSETPDTSKAGTYTISIAATLKNYYVTTVSGTLTILPAPPKRQPMGISAPDRVPGGTIEVDPKNATPGQTVTITVKPDKGYEIGDVTVRDIDGEKIDLVDEGDGEFTFVMPKSSVTVTGFFVREGEELFRDVPAGAYYYDAVRWAKQNGITSGIGDGLFGATLPCTRAQIVTFLWRAAGSPEPESAANFADVPASAYYAKAVAWAVEEGITNGIGDNKFDPDAPCTRAQCVTFLYRAAGSPKVSATPDFDDVAETAYYAKAVAWAQKQDITAGVSATRFAPEHDCTRAQIVTFLYRAFAE